ncbi:MAG TPA: transglutaminase domain-containing protein [Gemmataceae bacterium]|nr:transglutaminase domain-containing protein [Gemmataceae bacterium]
MMRTLLALLVLAAPALAAEPKTRTFRFTYEVTVNGLAPGEQARVWLPVPQTTDDQEVIAIDMHFPVEAALNTETRLGNQMFYLGTKADADGSVPLKVVYTIKRKEVKGETDKGLQGMLDQYLKFDPLSRPDGKQKLLLDGRKLPDDPMAKAKELYEIVNGMLRYAKDGTEWGRGDVDWVCDSKYGNCTDFHSLFIALARSEKIPARFEVGFGLPEKRGSGDVAGYHCWAKFKPEGKGWVPVDISEANKNPKMKDYYFGNLTEDRVTFSTGRDIVLAPKQDGPPLNFFVYPYVEVGGKPYPADKMKRKFGYEDVK